MAKRAIPSNRVYSDIDDYLSYYYACERDQLQDKGLLHLFIKKWEDMYFLELKNIETSKAKEDAFLGNDEKQIKHSHLAMKKVLYEIGEDILYQL